MRRRSAHTVGIDLAVQDRATASCRILWTPDGPKIDPPRLRRSDNQLLDDLEGADLVGIDAPFGWPEPFFKAVRAHRARKPWPGRGKGLVEYRETLRLRATDLVVKREVGLTPPSVAADKIAITTFRCALLLDRFEHELGLAVDRSGTGGRMAEVYPAAALRQFGLASATSYKAADAFEQRTKVVRGLARALGISRLPAAVERQCRASDHALDALISAVVARAVALRWTRAPRSSDERALAQVEGWIHFPHPQAARHLVAGSLGPNDRDAWPTTPTMRRPARTHR